MPRPPALFGEVRRNSLGLSLSEITARDNFLADMGAALREGFNAHPRIAGDDTAYEEVAKFCLLVRTTKDSDYAVLPIRPEMTFNERLLQQRQVNVFEIRRMARIVL